MPTTRASSRTASSVGATSDRPMRILVTGASGFLGSGIVRAFSAKHTDYNITGLDLRPPKSDVADKLERFFPADITDASTIKTAFEAPYKPDLVLHTAAIVPSRNHRYSRSEKQWQQVKSIIYDGTINVLNATLDAGCFNFIYTSSTTAIIDDLDHDYYNMDETTPTGSATLHYGRAKAMTERFVMSDEHRKRGLKACVLRPCTIIGPEDTQVISLLIDLIPKGETRFIVGDNNNLYDWMYIDNAVDAHVLAAENLLGPATAAGEIIFISNHEPHYFWDFLAFVWAQFGHYRPVPPIYVPAWLAYYVGVILELITRITGMPSTLDTGSVKDGIGIRYVNNDKAIRLLGYVPKVGLSEGVRRACAGYKGQLALKAGKLG